MKNAYVRSIVYVGIRNSHELWDDFFFQEREREELSSGDILYLYKFIIRVDMIEFH